MNFCCCGGGREGGREGGRGEGGERGREVIMNSSAPQTRHSLQRTSDKIPVVYVRVRTFKSFLSSFFFLRDILLKDADRFRMGAPPALVPTLDRDRECPKSSL